MKDVVFGVVAFITSSWLLCIRRLAETNTSVWNMNRLVRALGARCRRLLKHDVDFRSGRNADDDMLHGQHLHDLFVAAFPMLFATCILSRSFSLKALLAFGAPTFIAAVSPIPEAT
ncbi:MAG TPA: hypothetical protein VMU61_02870 [Candidatus Aquilonibacter sp.]|nr:hypothetical protein [Candidatus Aquilonibacter sp.]